MKEKKCKCDGGMLQRVVIGILLAVMFYVIFVHKVLWLSVCIFTHYAVLQEYCAMRKAILTRLCNGSLKMFKSTD